MPGWRHEGDMYFWLCIVLSLSVAAAALLCDPRPVTGAEYHPYGHSEQIRILDPSESISEVPVIRVADAISAAFPPERAQEAMAVAACETGWTFDWSAYVVDTDGLPRAGLWQVGEHWWGKVPSDPEGQARQAAAIVAEHGWAPWACQP